MSNQEISLKELVSHAKEYGFIIPSSEIYDGLAATYDYGYNGVSLKNKIKDYWWKSMTRLNENIVGIDAAILMHPTTWKASGHVDAFNDPLIDNKDSKKRYRADNLVEDFIEKINVKIQKEVKKAKKKFGNDFNQEEFLNTNQRVKQYNDKINIISQRLKESIESGDMESLKLIIEELGIACPVSGTKNWTEVRQFNLMFSTKMGSIASDADTIFLRPETAQGIFVNFLNVQKTARQKLPFGIAQIGKAFRNEIVARQFIFRMKEFEQMEMQYFIQPGTELEWYEKWKSKRMQWHIAMGIDPSKYRFHDHLNLAHYANAACDIEFEFPFGFKELEGIHSRTDFDLSRHQEFSGKKIQYYDSQTNTSFVPYVVETSIGLDRMVLAILSSALTIESLDNNTKRTVLKIPYPLAPTNLAILPLVNKSEFTALTYKLYNMLHLHFDIKIDAKDAIGRRYRRQDAIGTPFCVTIDHDSLEDNEVTIRDRNTMEQIRLHIEKVKNYIEEKTSIKSFLNSLK